MRNETRPSQRLEVKRRRDDEIFRDRQRGPRARHVLRATAIILAGGLLATAIIAVGFLVWRLSFSGRKGQLVSPTTERGIAFTNIRVFDGSQILDGQTVDVRGERIVAAGRSSEVQADSGAIDGRGRTLLPGFIDAHVHIGLYDPKRVIRGGITSARDLGWPPDRIFPLAERLEDSPREGPHLLVAGPMITAPGGYPTRAGWAPRGTSLEVSSENEARSRVRDLANRGASVIKVAQDSRQGPVLSVDLLRAVVEEAHAVRLRVTSHIGSLEQLEVALDAGVDELAHGLWSDEEIPGATIRRMVDAGMTVVPTLHIDPSPQRINNLRRFAAAGGRVVYGTDMGNSGPPPGIDAEELRLMVKAGIDPLRALASATSIAADYLGLEGRGRIAAGRSADLVLVEGDPLRDLSVLSRPLMVLREGVSPV